MKINLKGPFPYASVSWFIVTEVSISLAAIGGTLLRELKSYTKPVFGLINIRTIIINKILW